MNHDKGRIIIKRILFIILSLSSASLYLAYFYYKNPPVEQSLHTNTPFLFLIFSDTSFSALCAHFLLSVLILSIFASLKITKIFLGILLTILSVFIVALLPLVSGLGVLLVGVVILSLVYAVVLFSALVGVRIVCDRLPTYALSLITIAVLALSIYPSYVVYADYIHADVTALNSQLLNSSLGDIKASPGGYADKEQMANSLDMCRGFINAAYTQLCNSKVADGVAYLLHDLAVHSSDTPLDYCPNYIQTVSGGSIIKYSWEYWSGLNSCYKGEAKTLSDCDKIDTKLEQTSGDWNWADERLHYQDLKRTCVNLIKEGHTGADLY